MLIRLSIIISLILLVACSGDKADEHLTLLQGVFIDSEVQGLGYSTPSVSGVTDENGVFYYASGETVKFFLGDQLIGQTIGKSIISPDVLVQSDIEAKNLATLLQSLDLNDDSADGIQLPKNLAKLLPDTQNKITLNNEDFANDVAIQTLLAKTGKTAGLIDSNKAYFHLQYSLQQAGIESEKLSKLYSIGGVVLGLKGDLSLSLFNEENITISDQNKFEFQTKVKEGTVYEVSIAQQPDSQTCRILGGKGTVLAVDVSSISIICADNSTSFQGTVTGLTGTLLLAADNYKIYLSKNGSFAINENDLQSISIIKQPEKQVCSIENYENLIINCTNNIYRLSGSISNLHGELTLKETASNSLLYLDKSGNFSFATTYPDNYQFNIDVVSQPIGQTCTIQNSVGSISAIDNSDIAITCVDNRYTLSIEAVGNRAALDVFVNDNSIVANNSNLFQLTLVYNAPYKINLGTAPEGQFCQINNTLNTGTMPSSDLVIQVFCFDKDHFYNISVDNYLTPFTLIKNEELLIHINDSPVSIGANRDEQFNIEIKDQPVGQTCRVINGNGSVNSLNTKINISCEKNVYQLKIKTSNLKSPINIREKITEQSVQSGSGVINFSLRHGSNFNLFIETQPIGQICTFSESTGIISTTDIEVTLSCEDNHLELPVKITNLHGNIIVKNNNKEASRVVGDTIYFDTSYLDTYHLSINTQPSGQICAFNSPVTGTIETIAPETLSINCLDKDYVIKVSVAGLKAPELLITNNNLSPDRINSSENGVLIYEFDVLHSAKYSLNIAKPLGQTCNFSQTLFSGTIAGKNENFSVECINDNANIQFNISGLQPNESIKLNNNINQKEYIIVNSTQAVGITVNDSIEFYTDYEFTTSVSPMGKTCNVTAETYKGYANSTTVGPIEVVCSDTNYDVIFKINNLNNQITLYNNDSEITKLQPGQTSYTFRAALNTQYSFSLSNNIPSQQCSILNNASGTITELPRPQVEINCINKYKVGGAVSGLVEIPVDKPKLKLNAIINGALVNFAEIFNSTGSIRQSFDFGYIVKEATAITLNIEQQPYAHNCVFSDNEKTSLLIDNIQSDISAAVQCKSSIVSANALIEHGFKDENFIQCILEFDSGIWVGKAFSEVNALECSAPVNGPKIKSITGIEKFPNIKSLIITNHSIRDFQALRSLLELDKNIDNLKITENTYPLISTLVSGTDIDAILFDCIDTQYDIQIYKLDQVKFLDCSNWGLNSIKGIELFPNLVSLNLYQNNIKDITPIYNSTILDTNLSSNIEELILTANQITDIANQITKNANQITEITNTNSGLYKLKALQLLDLRDNLITDASSLALQSTGNTFYLSQLNYLNLFNMKKDLVGSESVLLLPEDTLFRFKLSYYNGPDVLIDQLLNNPVDGTEQNVDTSFSGAERNIDSEDFKDFVVFPIQVTNNLLISRAMSVTFNFLQTAGNKYIINLVSPHGTKINLLNEEVFLLSGTGWGTLEYQLRDNAEFHSLIGKTANLDDNFTWRIEISSDGSTSLRNGAEGKIDYIQLRFAK